MTDDFAADVRRRCFWRAVAWNGGHPNAAWSTGERLAVALALEDFGHIKEMGYTRAEAVERVRGGTWRPTADMDAWLAAVWPFAEETRSDVTGDDGGVS